MRETMKPLRLFLLILALCANVAGAAGETPEPWNVETFAGLKLRSIGPAFRSGRIADIARDPTDRSVWYVAVASGGVWKTVNNATTWTPVFDDEASYSIGCVTVDPKNPQVVWVGTGENNSQRSVGWGDGVYKSLDGGESWTRMGLEASEHIGKIVLDPRDSDVVYVASQGPLWAPGGERGLYKSADGGTTWERVLDVSENTGISDVVLDPRNPDVVYATSYQRRRHQWTVVAGGPESRIYKSSDAGKTWKTLTQGLPDGDVGRIGLALSPQNPDVVYATVAAADDDSGFYRSSNRGESWKKMSDYVPGDPQYYMEIYPDPHVAGRLYQADVWLHVSDDGGKSWRGLGSPRKHVDNHAVVFDPEDPDYLQVGCDGGIYESWDRGSTWRYVDNLPVTQFYRVGIDNDVPFYNLYGGTQDNDTEGGPSRTATMHGIRNSDWFITVGGDGYQTRVDPEDPNVLYSMWQYGGLVRYDKRHGETLDIQPQPEAGDAPLRWNWDSPLLISPHAPKRLYFAANRLFRSDDRGDTWRAVSPDLSRNLDRNELEVMGTVWSVDSVWKNVYTSFYGSIVALDESPLVEGLLYAGTDDGLVQVSDDGGQSWRAEDTFPGVPERSFVTDLTASQHDADRVYASFNNHKQGDFKPYLLRSDDRGRTWRSIVEDGLVDRHLVWSIVEDHEDENLLFAGTEYGLFFTRDGGGRWIQLQGDVPTVAFRDLEIQKRENDLVAATFGRGFYIFDDYSPLRYVDEETLSGEATLFPVKKTWMYVPSAPLSWGEKGVQGDAYFTAPNPPAGAVFTYYLRDGYKSRHDARREDEKARQKRGEPVGYPSWDELRTEDRAEDPAVLMVVFDEQQNVVRRVVGPAKPGFHRVAWDLRYPAFEPTSFEHDESPWGPSTAGPLAVPGTYSVRLAKRVDGELSWLSEAQSFETVPLGAATMTTEERAALSAFHRKAGRLQRAVMGTARVAADMKEELRYVKRALDETAGSDEGLAERARQLEQRLFELDQELLGDRTVRRRVEPVLPSIVRRIGRTVDTNWRFRSAPTTTHRRDYEIAAEAFEGVLAGYQELRVGLDALHQEMEEAGSPWTPGRGLPVWTRD